MINLLRIAGPDGGGVELTVDDGHAVLTVRLADGGGAFAQLDPREVYLLRSAVEVAAGLLGGDS